MNRNCKLPKDLKKKQITEVIIENDKYKQVDYLDYELENEDSIYEFTDIELEDEIETASDYD